MTEPARNSVAMLLDVPNIWSAWLDAELYGPLSPWRFAALMLRDVPIEQVINQLGPALLTADMDSREMVDLYADRHPLPPGVVFGFEHWLEVWDKEEALGYGDAVHNVMRRLDETSDASLFANAVSGRVIDDTSLLWFVLGTIQHWMFERDELRGIIPEARWLAKLYTGEAEWRDPLEVLFAFLYQRYRDDGTRPTKPLPKRMNADRLVRPPTDCSEPYGSTEARVLSWVANRDAVNGKPLEVETVLLFDTRSWPSVASDISALRGQGLLQDVDFVPTPLGTSKSRMQEARDRAKSSPWASTRS